jgi:hypothetical protein
MTVDFQGDCGGAAQQTCFEATNELVQDGLYRIEILANTYERLHHLSMRKLFNDRRIVDADSLSGASDYTEGILWIKGLYRGLDNSCSAAAVKRVPRQVLSTPFLSTQSM